MEREAAYRLDALDVRLLGALVEHPRAGVLELSRRVRVARATVQARLTRMEEAGVVTGYGPDVDLRRAGYAVHAFVTLEIAQGGLDEVSRGLAAIPGVLEAWATTGTGDVLARIAATSHEDLQATLIEVTRSAAVVRSTSVVALSVVVAPRVLPLLRSTPRDAPTRAPAYRATPRLPRRPAGTAGPMSGYQVTEVQKALKGADYPMDGSQLAQLAQSNGAEEGLVDALRGLRQVDGPNTVMQELKGQLGGSTDN